MAKLARLGPAQNDEPMQTILDLSMFFSMKYIKTQRKPCQAYVEDQYIHVLKCEKRNSITILMIFRSFGKFQKNENFQEKLEKMKIFKEKGKGSRRRGTLRVLRAETWLTVDRTIANTETIAQLARLGPAKNGELLTKFCRVSKVLLDEVYEDSKKTLSRAC